MDQVVRVLRLKYGQWVRPAGSEWGKDKEWGIGHPNFFGQWRRYFKWRWMFNRIAGSTFFPYRY